MPIQATCRISGKPFTITDRDLEFYQKIGVPPPTLCPEERRRRRFSFRNERSLYRRKSSLSGKDIISCIHPNDPWPAYSTEEWHGDSWDGTQFGRAYDFNKSFSEQYGELQKVVPAIAINSSSDNENCQYANYVAADKNCYMIFGSVYCEDCLYGNPYYCKSCIDSFLVRDSELCYECVTCEKCYECFYCQDCADSFSLMFCYDCHGCKNCVGCTGLRNKEYYIFNKQYSKEDFFASRGTLNFCDPEQVRYIKKRFYDLKLQHPRRYSVQLKTENCTGDYVYSSKNSHNCFDVQRCEDCSYCAQIIDMKDCYDCNYMEECELCYEYICHYQNQRIFFSCWCHASNDVWYSSYCVSSNNLLGCIGLKHKDYCILNKQYTKEEFEDLRPRVMEQMKREGVFGEFFNPALSYFCYNETVAQEYFPLTREEALAQGYRWREKDARNYLPQAFEVPADISKVPDSIVNEILACKQCGKNYKLLIQELNFYKNYRLPVPGACSDCRQAARLALRNPRNLFERNCKKCGVSIKTTYAEDRPESVYCEKCYLEAVY